MKTFLILIFLLYCNCSFGQLKIRDDLIIQYHKIFKRLPHSIQAQENILYPNGLGILTVFKEDTLNPEEIIVLAIDSPIKNFSDDIEAGKEIEIKTLKNNFHIDSLSPIPLLCNCEERNDSLIIVSYIGSFSGFSITNILYKNKLRTFYKQWDTQVKEFKLNLTDEMSYTFTAIPKISVFMLNKKPTDKAKEIYGKIDLTTPNFYDFSNNWNYKNGYIHKRIRLQYYFRCTKTKQHTT